MQHAPLAPSSAPQWGNCAGSVRAQSAFPNKETEETRRGTAAHWVAACVLIDYRAGVSSSCGLYEGRQAPNGVIIDDEMAEGAQTFVDEVVRVVEHFNELFSTDIRQRLRIEHRVYMAEIHPENWGTLDAALDVPEFNLLFIWDYKHGHRDCQPEGNLQLIDYLKGLTCELGINDQSTYAVATIVQPFCYYADGPVKSWEFQLSDLRPYWNQLKLKAEEAFSPNPTLNTGPWCTGCRAVGICAPAKLAGYNFIDMLHQPYQMDNMTGADLAFERSIVKNGISVAKARLEAIEDQLQQLVADGDVSSRLCLSSSPGRERWTAPREQVVILCGQLGVDASKPGLKTPKQVRDSAPKEVRPYLAKLIRPLTERPPGKLKLTPAENTVAFKAFKKRTQHHADV